MMQRRSVLAALPGQVVSETQQQSSLGLCCRPIHATRLQATACLVKLSQALTQVPDTPAGALPTSACWA